MKRPLDPLNFKQNVYNRPEQDWICGRAAEGRPCPLGPDRRGNCRATGECHPAKRGDRWHCTRIEARGGRCQEGPLPDGTCSHVIPPCVPVRSLRKLRGMAVSLVAFFTVGVLFCVLGGKWRSRFLDPGELSTVHGMSSAVGAGASNCKDCHSRNAGGAMAEAAMSFSHRQLADSRLCLNCHALGDHPLQAHGMAASALAEATRKAQPPQRTGAAPLFLKASHAISAIDPQSSALNCATCHGEHRGRDAHLAQFSNEQCQVCHRSQFASFSRGHPQFDNYPYRRRTRIFFDHTKHIDDYFAKDKEHAPSSCQACHSPGGEGRQMLVKSFQETCAACHERQIKGEGLEFKGLAFFSIPELDVQTLESKGHRIGQWPRADGKLTPFMEFLLSGDPGVRTALERLHGVELFDLAKADAGQLEAAEKIAWAIKSLLFDLTTQGQDFLLKQIKAVAPPNHQAIPSALVGRMPRAVVMVAQSEWMPDLLSEVASYRQGIKPPPPAAAKPPRAPSNAAPQPANPAGGDLLDTPPPTEPKKPADKDSILDPGDLLKTPPPEPATGKVPGGKKDDSIRSGGNNDLLDAAAAPAGGKSPKGSGEDSLAAPVAAAAGAAASGGKSVPAAIVPAEDWVATGGWYRPTGSFTLFYRPIGHADPFLQAWLSMTTAAAARGDRADVGRALFRRLASPETPGQCIKCHTVDQEGSAWVINWLTARPDPEVHRFTVFNHTAHFSLLREQGCQTCHQRDASAEYAKFYMPSGGLPPMDATQFASNFAPLSTASCASCHKPQIAGDNCLLCHRYHTGRFVSKAREASGFHTAQEDAESRAR